MSIPDGQLLQGNLPPKQMKLLLAWIALHEEELMIDWDLSVQGQEPFRIPPLQ